jgi:hypothetical protein
VFLRDFADRWQEVARIIPIVTNILYEDAAFVHAIPYRAGAYEDRTPIMGRSVVRASTCDAGGGRAFGQGSAVRE